MKVYIGPYDHWFQPATWLKKRWLWWHGFGDNQHWHVIQRIKHNATTAFDECEEKIQKSWLYRFLKFFERWVQRHTERTVRIRIDKYDVWNLGDTLALIVLPMLYEFKRQGVHGAPHVEDEDVPEYLRSTAAPPLTEEEQNTGHVDKLWHERWHWVLEEMIWAFEQVNDPDADSHFHTDADPAKPRNEPGISFQESMQRGAFDREGYEKFYARKINGLRLFGKYLEALWN